MRVTGFKAMLPCVIVIALTVIPFLFHRHRTAGNSFPVLLTKISTERKDSIPLAAVNDRLRFLEAGIQPRKNPADALAIADLHYQVAQALFTRKVPDSLPGAVTHYEKAIALAPNLLHGWPFFQMGFALEKMNRHEEAIERYQSVFRYDFGRLALTAGYRMALIDTLTLKRPIDPSALYLYLRYASENVFQDVLPFEIASMPDTNETTYIRALLAGARHQDQIAASRMYEYLHQNPDDYSAAYFYNQFSKNHVQIIYPADGRLLHACYAPRAYRHQGLTLAENIPVNVDFYVPSPNNRELLLEARFNNDSLIPIQFSFTLNKKIRIVQTTTPIQNRLSVRFRQIMQRNILNLHVQRTAGTSDDSILIDLYELNATPLSGMLSQ